MREKLSSSSFIFIWFSAAVSLAEILTGTFFAPLGFEQGMYALLWGHVIGCFLFWLVAYLGAKTGKSAMKSVRISFGRYGSFAFSFANIAQLVGWTAIMIFSGAAAAAYLVPTFGIVGWCVVIGALIMFWIARGLKQMSRVQTVSTLLLFALSLFLSFLVFEGALSEAYPGGILGAADTSGILSATATSSDALPGASSLSFGAAVELAVAMPLSWLPVVSDYTCRAKKPFAAASFASLSYFFGSSWMYTIGLGLALFVGSSDVTTLFAGAGLGIVGILIVVFSTVTTTFLDAASAGTSMQNIIPRANAQVIGVSVTLLGVVLAIALPVMQFEGFLYLIGSIFAPMTAILIVDFFLLHNDSSDRALNVVNLVLWAGGFVLYRFSMSWDSVLGNTLPVLVIIGLVSLVVHLVLRKTRRHFTRKSHSKGVLS